MPSIDKAEARRRARALAASLPPAAVAEESRAAAALLLSRPEFAEAELLLVFLSMPGEIDTAPLVEAALAAGKRVAAPRIEGGDLAFVPLGRDWRDWPPDRWGIPDPPASARALGTAELGRLRVLVAAPGLLFDAEGRRLGRGKGFYDRFLRGAREAAREGGGSLVACGYALSVQLVPEAPAGPGDEAVDLVIAGGRLSRTRTTTRS